MLRLTIVCMKKLLMIILMSFVLPIAVQSCAVMAQNYNVYMPENYNYNPEAGERTLFILDFSNSMTEYIDGRRKVDLMLDTMREILPRLSKNNSIGLRVYGHRMGFTSYDMCRASSLLVPIGAGNAELIQSALVKSHPRGMTPITYSLKEAVRNDFLGFTGKKHIILLTDGGENCDESPCTFAMELIKVRKDVSIDVIAFNITDEDDLEQLECTALVTSGKFYSAETEADLTRSLNNSLNVKKDVEAKIMLP